MRAAGRPTNARDLRLELDVRRGRAVDEPHRAGAGAEDARRLVGRFQQRRMVRQRQVAVAVHPDELAVAALQLEARTPAVARRDVADENPLGRLRPPFLFECRDFRYQ